MNKLLAAYAAFVSATLASVVVAGEVLPVWARLALGAFSGTGAAAGIMANLRKEVADDRGQAKGP